MITAENSNASTDNRSSDTRKQSPPAFLDLADSAARLGTNMPDMSARVELKRLEHERQRLLQRKMFEDQMRALEQQQAQELLCIPYDPSASAHLAVSAPTTPPRVNAVLNSDNLVRTALSHSALDAESLSKAVGSAVADKRKSVTYAPSVHRSPELGSGHATNGHYGRPAGAKSMPASRRTSASSHDEELAGHLQGLSLVGERPSRATPSPAHSVLTRGRYSDEERTRGQYNVGMMLDEQLDQEMHNAMRNLPTSDEDKFASYANRITTSSAALDLAHRSQTSPRNSFSARGDKHSEWPQFSNNPRVPDGLSSRNDRRTVTNPTLTLTSSPVALSTTRGGGASTPHAGQHSQASLGSGQAPVSRRGSPSAMSATRSVPATPLTMANGGSGHLLQTPGTPLTPDSQALSGRLSSQGSYSLVEDSGKGEIQPSLSRMSSGQFDNGSIGYDQYEDGAYGLNGQMDGRFNSYDVDSSTRSSQGTNGASGSTALYHHNGTRYGLHLGRGNGADGKMNGLHGPKHKRGDMDLNRFTGTRLEDLQGEIPTLCKDQHGCRYLQKKLEEGVPEHRDMIFRETFGHFAELMTDPFGNYLCQKLLEFSTDDQRNVICESVAQDLVTISLNMHGTRAVQKMIDFLSTRRQTDHRYNTQIHSIILALSLHVVVLIKDLNGNHVIQKCLNKLAPEDNQFIYNAVAANCVEVATHRHGCCVLQRCIDHASDHQRVQLVNEITYNALTLVQDPYGNYVVQYILDLNDSRFSDAVIRQFTGNVCALSVQKFSSNVIEKCIRVAEHSTRKILIEELLNRSRLEKLLRDSYGNYCVQTALDYADPAQRMLLVEGIRPVLPLIRNTPYGKRIQNKLQREQANAENFGYHAPQGMMPMGNPGHHGHHSAGVRHTPQAMHPAGSMADMYGAQGGLYGIQGQGSYGHSHLGPQIHGLQARSIDGYVLQGNSPHNPSPPHSHATGYTGVAGYANVSPFGTAGIAGSLNDPYQSYGYGGM
ncbi:ARM repeat-containing protein [Rhizopogon vinicolor AM-OR11-026]|uniref:ARM repeat-containing protein n=1 Tax=Rhizopogon vinicolor AM-OR11-026 TaxID=1314800 RepID=A0A1B7NFT5_9AGAM|nr:ARM repeat-containing protein [Rhizopogon vinicolor AM-OR11-026]